MAFRYNVGDRVITNRAIDGETIPKGSTGTIAIQDDTQFDSGWIGVVWDDLTCGHDLDGACEDGHGWYVYDKFLDLLPDFEIDDVDFDDPWPGF